MTVTTTPHSEQWSQVLVRAATLAGEYLAELPHRAVAPSASPQELRRLLGGQLALRWVQRNIREFGVDPDNVTSSGYLPVD